MAFWKIVGFEVIPVSASSRIRLLELPGREEVAADVVVPDALAESIQLLQRIGGHDDTLLARVPDAGQGVRFDLLHLVQPPHVALGVRELRAEKRAHHLGGERRRRSRARRDRARSCRRPRRPGARRTCRGRAPPDPRHLVRRDRGPDAAAADDDPALALPRAPRAPPPGRSPDSPTAAVLSVPKSTTSWPSSRARGARPSFSGNPAWSNPTATFIPAAPSPSRPRSRREPELLEHDLARAPRRRSGRWSP